MRHSLAFLFATCVGAFQAFALNFTLTLDKNAADARGSWGPFSVDFKAGETKTLVLGECGISRPGYVLAGWSERRNGEKSDYLAPGVTVLRVREAGSLKLYAIWLREASYGLAFDPGVSGAEWTMPHTSVRVGSVGKLPTCALTPPAGRRCLGWECNGRRYDPEMLLFGIHFQRDPIDRPATTNEIVVFKALWAD